VFVEIEVCLLQFVSTMARLTSPRSHAGREDQDVRNHPQEAEEDQGEL
jgi:hypothetical protein